MGVKLDSLPYQYADLEPHISAETLKVHYTKHHQGYVNKLNDLIIGSELDRAGLEDIILSSYKKEPVIFNNAAQIWNHTFYWNSMKRNGGGAPPGGSAIETALVAEFGSYEVFRDVFLKAGIAKFGSGWVWLVMKGDRPEIVSTSDADIPWVESKDSKPLFVMDVWEHSYYLDRQNRRPEYVEAFIAHLINWDFAEQNLSGANPRIHAG